MPVRHDPCRNKKVSHILVIAGLMTRTLKRRRNKFVNCDWRLLVMVEIRTDQREDTNANIVFVSSLFRFHQSHKFWIRHSRIAPWYLTEAETSQRLDSAYWSIQSLPDTSPSSTFFFKFTLSYVSFHYWLRTPFFLWFRGGWGGGRHAFFASVWSY